MRVEMVDKTKVLDVTAHMMGNKQQDMEKVLKDLNESVTNQWWGPWFMMPT